MNDELMQLLTAWEVWEKDWINCPDTWPLWSPFPILTTRTFAGYLKIMERRRLFKEKLKNYIAVQEKWMD